MKIIILSIAVLCAFLNTSSFAESINLFASVELIKDSIKIKFYDEGIRYRIELNKNYIGISNYGQVLSVNKSDTLKLIEKHSYYVIINILMERKNYLKIVQNTRDPAGSKIISKEYYIKLKVINKNEIDKNE